MSVSARRAFVGVALLGLAACKGHPQTPAAPGSLVVTQIPQSASRVAPASVLDERYPPGSRVILAFPPLGLGNTRLLSQDLVAAGEPFVSADGHRILFSGKGTPDGTWQIYEASLADGNPKALTSMDGGASSPALLADGNLVFTSPVPAPGEGWFPKRPVALWALGTKETAPKQLSFGAASVADPTVLTDGRILFVSALASEAGPARVSLFVVYNDGTGILPYACQHDGATEIGRPREIHGGKVAFLSSSAQAGGEGFPETVLEARPWLSRGPLLTGARHLSRSTEPDGDGNVLVTLQRKEATPGSWAIFLISQGAMAAGEPLFDDPSWDEVEAVRVEPRKPPMGRISTMDSAKGTGVLFCMDVNHTTYEKKEPATRIRITTSEPGGATRPLGEVPVHADGSFMAAVPANIPLGFEALDKGGNVLRRVAPSVWLRPGENRGCIGCHEAHGLAPRNRRPLAVKAPPAKLDYPAGSGAPAGS